MTDYQRPHAGQHEIGRDRGYGYDQHRNPTDAMKGYLPENGPNKSQVLAVVTLLPVGGFLLLLAGLTLAGTVIGLTVATPLFVIFSPILVPAVIALGLAITGFLTSGAFGVTALSAISWIVNYLRSSNVTDHLEYGKRRAQDAVGYVGQKTQDAVGYTGQKTQDAVGYTGQKMKDAGQKTQDSART